MRKEKTQRAFILFSKALMNYLRPEINIADLLEREVIPLQLSDAKDFLAGRVVLVTGAAGSIGSELCRQLLTYEPARLIALDTNETGLFDLVENLKGYYSGKYLYPYIGDITNRQQMSQLFTEERPQVVFHAAAYKHVPLLEQFPAQAIQTNVLATYQMCNLARQHQVSHFIFISSDKAADAVGVMGATKRIGEMIIQTLADISEETRFCAVRFGNVLGSRGSVVPLFTRQIERGGPITITDPNTTRYFMTIPEACELVILAATIAPQGGLYLLDMGNPVKIVDLAMKMLRWHHLKVERDIDIVYTGLRPGERLHETLVGASEELTATAHKKIFSVAHQNPLHADTTLAQWMQVLEEGLWFKSNEQLREHLFQIVHRRGAVPLFNSQTTFPEHIQGKLQLSMKQA